ncbi:MAG: BrnA antitoxin family protein [Fretibacterium sp.]|nr:BrnA antitoxin family protein [Fretibacterium sp.]
MEQKLTGKTDFERLRNMKDDEIDCSDIPALTDEELASPEWFATYPHQELFTLSVDRSVIDFFRKQGRGYRERMNDVLRDYVAANA